MRMPRRGETTAGQRNGNTPLLPDLGRVGGDPTRAGTAEAEEMAARTKPSREREVRRRRSGAAGNGVIGTRSRATTA